MKLINIIPWQIKLVVLMLLMAVLPSFLISTSITGRLRDELKSNIDGQLIFSASSVSSSINSRIKKSIENLELIKKMVENKNLDPNDKIALMVSSTEKIDNFLSLSLFVKDNNKFSEVVSTEKDAIHREGNQVISLTNMLDKVDLNNLAIDNDKLPYLSTPIYKREIKTWTCRLILKVNVPKLPPSYLVAQLDLNDIEKEIDNHFLNKIGVLFVTNESKMKFLSSRLITNLPEEITADANSVLKGGKSVLFKNSYSSEQYGNYISCFSISETPKWVVVSAIQEDAAYATVREAFMFFSIFVLISALLSVIIALLFSKHLSKPIIKMANTSELIANGNFDAAVDYPAKDSIGVLNSSLSQMGKQLKYNFNEIERQKEELEDYSKNLEKKVEQRTFELSESNKELKRAYKKVLELDQEKNEFLGIAAHDLKNPLVAISSFAEILLEDKNLTKEQYEDFLKEINKASKRMFRVIKDLLDVNALEQGKINIQMEPVSIKGVFNDLIMLFRENISKKNINIIEYYNEASEIISDRNIITQILQNVFSNALKFSPLNKNIYLSAQPAEDDQTIIIKIKDEGPGFTDSDKMKVFQKFAKLSARPTGGEDSSGLGLSIVKKLVELLGGRIDFESEIGKGSEFIITLSKSSIDKNLDEN
jgi:signal transduction histidine kinase